MRAKLEEHLEGEPVAGDIWDALVEGHHVGDAIAEDDLDGLAVAYGAMRNYRASQRRKRASPRTEPVELPPDRRSVALAEIRAIEAAEDLAVVTFRSRVLRGRLIKPERVRAWVERKAASEGPATPFLYMPDFPPLIDPDARDDAWLEEVRTGAWVRTYDYLRFPTESSFVVGLVRIRFGGVLYQLQTLARLLVVGGWPTEEAAVAFVLSGQPPTFPSARVIRNWAILSGNLGNLVPGSRWAGTLASVTIEASVRLDARQVGALFQDAKESMLGEGARSREISEKHARLAVFANAHNTGGTWREAMNAWNRANPEFGYAADVQFIRDARQAYKRVMGRPLDWKSARRKADVNHREAR